jgi:hypothetical protein
MSIELLGISSILVEYVKDLMSKSKEVSESGNLENIKKEEDTQEISIQMFERQAKVLQEIAIATRIEHAEEVEIEEYYDSSGEGSVGLNSGADSVNLGASGKGNRVTRRIYRFKGSHSNSANDILVP